MISAVVESVLLLIWNFGQSFNWFLINIVDSISCCSSAWNYGCEWSPSFQIYSFKALGWASWTPKLGKKRRKCLAVMWSLSISDWYLHRSKGPMYLENSQTRAKTPVLKCLIFPPESIKLKAFFFCIIALLVVNVLFIAIEDTYWF